MLIEAGSCPHDGAFLVGLGSFSHVLFELLFRRGRLGFDIPVVTSIFISVLVVLGLLLYTFRILREYERGVVFMLGRLWRVKGPGLIMVLPFIQQMVRVDLRPACWMCRLRT